MKKVLFLFLLILVIVFISFSGKFLSSTNVVNVDRKIKSNVFDKYQNEFIFVFFGYVGCTDICTPRLSELIPIYKKLKKDSVDIKVLFVNMVTLIDPALPDLFASSFHKDFTGIYLEKDILMSIQREFDVFNIPSLVEEGEYNHTSFLFLLQKNKDSHYRLKRIYTHVPFDKNIITEDVKVCKR